MIERIAKIIYDHNKERIDSYGLLGGSMGEILFLYYYSLIDSSYRAKADELADGLIDFVSLQSNYLPTYCNGLAGLGFGFHLLEENGFIENTADLMEDIDVYLSHNLDREIAIGNYDFLHGAIGIGFYFLKHYKYNPEYSKTQLQKIFHFLKTTVIIDNDKNTVKWEAPETYKQKDPTFKHADFNISLSHGMSSIVIFLSELIKLDIFDQAETESLTNRAVNYILEQRIDRNTYGCYFPSYAIESTEVLSKSRLAWCYGDLGVAVALWQAGKTLNRKDILGLSKEILEYSALKRRNVQENYVLDAGLCHGSSGIAQIFFRMYLETELPILKEAADYWNNVTMKMAYHKDGPAGFKIYHGKENGWMDCHNLLEGIAGIGLSMLSPINPTWDEALLLSHK